eukprot:gene763-406_t
MEALPRFCPEEPSTQDVEKKKRKWILPQHKRPPYAAVINCGIASGKRSRAASDSIGSIAIVLAEAKNIWDTSV